jgi:hypothetical protein
MDGKETFAQDSFEKQGSGFHYSYDGSRNTLSIASLERQKIFARLTFDYKLTKNPQTFVSALDKTNQIKALMYSNNQTLNLTETLDSEKVTSLLDITAQISRYTCDLLHQDYEIFSERFCRDFGLKSFEITKAIAPKNSHSLYSGQIKTQHNNAIAVQGPSLPALIHALSDRTVCDLITLEFGHTYGNSAQNLLNASSKLSIISRVLDKGYTPTQRTNQEIFIKNKASSDS